MNYEEEVKKVYPDAFIDFNEKLNAGNVYGWYFDTPFGRMPKRICSLLSENDRNIAWKLTYDTLVLSGKIDLTKKLKN